MLGLERKKMVAVLNGTIFCRYCSLVCLHKLNKMNSFSSAFKQKKIPADGSFPKRLSLKDKKSKNKM